MYRKAYRNDYLNIKVFTNTKRILTLVDNFLDFSNHSRKKPAISIRFYLREFSAKKPSRVKRLSHNNFILRNKKVFFPSGSVATVAVNPVTGIVTGDIYGYKESSKEPILDFIFSQPLQSLLAGRGLFFIHASAVCKGNHCILINGIQGSGKSTLALTLAQNKFTILADDDCFIKLWKNKIKLFVLPTKMGLRDKIISTHPQVKQHIIPNYRYGGKSRFSLNSSCASNNDTKTLNRKVILFSRYNANGGIYIKQLSHEEALFRLAKQAPLFYTKEKFKKIQDDLFWTLYNFVRNAKSFDFVYNDGNLDEVSKVINNIISKS